MVMPRYRPPVAQPRVLTVREEFWLRIYAAVAEAFNSDGPACRSWADKALEAFDERFPPK